MGAVRWQGILPLQAQFERPLTAACVPGDYFLGSNGSIGAYMACTNSGVSVGEDKALVIRLLVAIYKCSKQGHDLPK